MVLSPTKFIDLLLENYTLLCPKAFVIGRQNMYFPEMKNIEERLFPSHFKLAQ
jgi:hypothetical protein